MWIHEMWIHSMWIHNMWIHSMWIHDMWITIGCNNAGGGGIFPQVKRLAAKWIGIRKRLFSGFLTASV